MLVQVGWRDVIIFLIDERERGWGFKQDKSRERGFFESQKDCGAASCWFSVVPGGKDG